MYNYDPQSERDRKERIQTDVFLEQGRWRFHFHAGVCPRSQSELRAASQVSLRVHYTVTVGQMHPAENS